MTKPASPLEASQPYVKVYASRCDVAIRAFIDVFHDWVRERLTGELLIDVHDYSHVHDGPGVIVVGHGVHYGIDRRDGRLGLVYRSRRDAPGPIADKLGGAAKKAFAACDLLETQVDGLKFDRGDLLVGFEDRLRAPAEAFERLRAEISAFAGTLLEDPRIEAEGDPRDLLGARLTGRPLQAGSGASHGTGTR